MSDVPEGSAYLHAPDLDRMSVEEEEALILLERCDPMAFGKELSGAVADYNDPYAWNRSDDDQANLMRTIGNALVAIAELKQSWIDATLSDQARRLGPLEDYLHRQIAKFQ